MASFKRRKVGRAKKSKLSKSNPTPTLRKTPESPVTKFPPELLTTVFSYLSSDVTNVRLVCHGFRDCAWPSFGERLGDTTFDIRRIFSMTNLQTIAENPRLSPHIKFLRFATGYVSDEYPGQSTVMMEDLSDDASDDDYPSDRVMVLDPDEYLPGGTLARLECFRHHGQPWFPASWDWVPCLIHHTDTVEKYAVTHQKQGVIEFLAKTLWKFNSLRGIEYLQDHYPVSFEDLREEIIEVMEEQGAESWADAAADRQAMDFNGLDMIFHALVTGNIKLKDLSIPVPAASCRAIATHTSPDIVRKALASVETLRIGRNFSRSFEHHLNREQKVILSASNFPKLRSMFWTTWPSAPVMQPPFDDGDPDVDNKMTTMYPPIQRLDFGDRIFLKYGEDLSYDDSFFTYLETIGSTLKILSFPVTLHLNWAPLILFLATSADITLQQLNIFYKDGKGVHLFHEVPPKEILYQAAQVVSIEPPSFREYLEKKWDSGELAGWLKPNKNKQANADGEN